MPLRAPGASLVAALSLVACAPEPERREGATRLPAHGSEQPQPGERETFRRLLAAFEAVPAIDTHDHLFPWDRLRETTFVETPRGRGMTLSSVWQRSYFTWYNPLTPWDPKGSFAKWWSHAQRDFDNARASSFYRYQLPAFQDLYGVDFDRISDAEAEDLDRRIFENYRDPAWITHVITERANIELVVNDPWWGRLDFATHYPFEVLVFNVTMLVRGFHPSEFAKPSDDPYRFAAAQGLKVESLDDYLAALDLLFETAMARGAVCLKSTLAYHRSLRFENVPKERAAAAFGWPKGELTEEAIRDFENYIMWQLVERSARYGLPFQIHTGDAQLEGSNPMLLLNLIEANPKTTFVIFHGGYPWVGETCAIVMRHASHVWVDSCWLPTLNYTMARRAYQEWLDGMPSNRILWGADCNHAEGVYGATVLTRRCLADALAEKVDRRELREEDALRIGRQILRENALELFPQLKQRLWKR